MARGSLELFKMSFARLSGRSRAHKTKALGPTLNEGRKEGRKDGRMESLLEKKRNLFKGSLKGFKGVSNFGLCFRKSVIR